MDQPGTFDRNFTFDPRQFGKQDQQRLWLNGQCLHIFAEETVTTTLDGNEYRRWHCDECGSSSVSIYVEKTN